MFHFNIFKSLESLNPDSLWPNLIKYPRFSLVQEQIPLKNSRSFTEVNITLRPLSSNLNTTKPRLQPLYYHTEGGGCWSGPRTSWTRKEWDILTSVDAKNGFTCQDWTKDTRDTDQVLKSVLKHNAAFCCAHWCHNWIPEIL